MWLKIETATHAAAMIVRIDFMLLVLFVVFDYSAMPHLVGSGLNEKRFNIFVPYVFATSSLARSIAWSTFNAVTVTEF
jgi:hypothetical protein